MLLRARRAMTLLELVASLVITAMIAAGGAAAFASLIDHRRMVRGVSVATERTWALRQTLRSWITSGQIQIQIAGGPQGLTNTMAAVSPAAAIGDEITFTTQAVNPSSLPNARIRLYVDGDASTPERGLCIEYQGTATHPIARRMLDSSIDTMHVEYLDGATHRWIPASRSGVIATEERDLSTPSVLAVRLWMASGASRRASALLGVPMVFRVRPG